METLILNLPTEAKQFITTEAASQQISPEELVLQTFGFALAPSPIEECPYTTDDFNEETLEAIREAEENPESLKVYTNVDDLFIDILGKDWKNV